MTSRQTNASRGKVLSILRPKQLDLISGAVGKKESTYKRAILTMTLSDGKLLSTLPWVRSPKERNPARAIARQAAMEMDVE